MKYRTLVGSAVALVGLLAIADGSAGAQQSTPCGPAPASHTVIVSDDALIEGTDGNDFICAGDSGNRILAGAGDDIIHTGAGSNTVFGQAGNDRIDGGPGRDRIIGGAGADLVFGHEGRDLIRGGAGNDVLVGGAGRDRVLGQDGDDVLRGNGGRDVLTGGTGDDRADGGRSPDRCIDTLHVKRCDEIVGLISVMTGFDGEPLWEVDELTYRNFAFSDDARFVVFAGFRIGETRTIEVVVRDIVENRFTVVGQSRPLRRPHLCGLDISGDGTTIAFSSNHHDLFDDPDDIGGLRLFIVDRETNGRELWPKFRSDLTVSRMCLPQLSEDGSAVLYSLGLDPPHDAGFDHPRSIVRHDLDQQPELIDRHEVWSGFSLWEPQLSGDGSTVVFQSGDSRLPGEVNGRSVDVAVQREDGSGVLGFTDIRDERMSYRAAGINHDGSVVAAVLRRGGTYAIALGFYDFETGSTLSVRAAELCPRCRFNESAFENDWAAAGMLQKEVDGPSYERVGIALLSPDSRTDVIPVSALDESVLRHISPDGRAIGLWGFEGDPYQIYFRDPADL